MTENTQADVIIVGAGPAGSASAIHLAKAGLSTLLLEKADFPREKICGDGLTPRAIRELAYLGIDLRTSEWVKTTGLRIHVGRSLYHMPWPTLNDFPAVGMVARRSIFDQSLRDEAARAGAVCRTSHVQGPLLDKLGRIIGVTSKDGSSFSAPIVIEASGNSARLAVAMGIHRMATRAMGVAVRTYFRSPLAESEWLDSWLELWDGDPGHSNLLPGYGWSFPLNDGTCNVGLGLPDAKRYADVDLKKLMARWLKALPEGLGFTQTNQTEPIASAALPMGFNRKPTYSRGLLLVGDSAGVVNPFNGEGISYAMESARFAAEAIVDAHRMGFHTRGAEQALATYPSRLASEWGGYFWLGNLFGKIIANPSVMRTAAHWGLPIPVVRHLTHRMLAHLADRPAHDAYSAVVNALTRIVPSA